MSNKKSKTEFEALLRKPGEEKWREAVEYRKANKAWLKLSADIALRVLGELKGKKMTQIQLAERMGVTPQQVNKILKGRENLKLETISKLEAALAIKLCTVVGQDEIVLKNNLDSLMDSLATEMDKQFITKSIDEMSQRTENKQAAEITSTTKGYQVGAEQTYASAPAKGKRGTGESNYSMAA